MRLVTTAKLNQRGNAVGVTIPRHFLHYLGWICGRQVVVELNDDHTSVTVRLPQQSDFGLTMPAPPMLESMENKPR